MPYATNFYTNIECVARKVNNPIMQSNNCDFVLIEITFYNLIMLILCLIDIIFWINNLMEN